ncbi:Glycosyltransferase involved in cell wall bisynthesis [Salinimicrobium catena]|uniref:Glycosyltransferase involved in cell wall bisynthesis n=1 Tax=Salinimicrobium catena TaxID=390640 RepID=A0A1H5NA09_9FLAO|nr:glycosyltransferase family 4 protein [Salinimicrobium catena]SDL40810.1 Glycosyltransferase involved in cell wall bisynthesis [Salinimicrobium catena]SEE98395.1 Glycosyltransferase involved in cell wall bisynthesis [Salinimicrobium catena]
MRFVIFTHVEHVPKGSSYFAYAPYIKEMNLWLQLVKEVEVVAPLRKELRFNAEAYRHDRLIFTSIPAFDLLSPKNALVAILKFPVIFARTLAAMHRADHLHLRCPGNIGLIACICQIFFPKKSKTAKYAGNWDPAAKQPWTYRLQKWILKNPFLTRNMQALVYGEWDKGSKNVVPFFTASFSEKEIPEVEEKRFSGPLTFLFVGNLVPGKQPLEAVKLVEAIHTAGTDEEIGARLEVYGDGPEWDRLENYCKEHGLGEQVIFHGSRPLQDLKIAYQKAHFVILPSRSEGWPKAIAEGMFYGCIPIATPVSCVPWMLDYGSRGILLSDPFLQKICQFEYSSEPAAAGLKNVSRTGFSLVTGEEKEVVRGQRADIQNSKFRIQGRTGECTMDKGENVLKILSLLSDQEEMKRMSDEAKKWSQQYTLERFEGGIKEVLGKRFIV